MAERKWYPNTLPEKAAWHTNFDEKAHEFANQAGYTSEILKQIAIDAQVIRQLADMDMSLDGDLKDWRDARDAYSKGAAGLKPPFFPTITFPMLPDGAMTGIADRTFYYADVAYVGAGYTKGIGEAMGIVAAAPPAPAPDSLKPTAKLSNLINSKVKIIATLLRQKSIRVMMQRGADINNFTHLGDYADREIIDETPLLVPNQPETRRYQLMLLRKGEPIGQPSDIYEIVVG